MKKRTREEIQQRINKIGVTLVLLIVFSAVALYQPARDGIRTMIFAGTGLASVIASGKVDVPDSVDVILQNALASSEEVASRIDTSPIEPLISQEVIIKKNPDEHVKTKPKVDNNWHKYISVHLSQGNEQNLADLKKSYPAYFGWLADTDVIYLTTVSIKFKQSGYFKGKFLPIDESGYVVYMYNGYQANYQDGEYLNAERLPLNFQYHGKAGDTKTYQIYSSKHLTSSLGRYLVASFLREG